MSSTVSNLNDLSINKLTMSLGTRVRIIASVAHRLVVERSYIFKTLMYASLQIVSINREFLAIHPICY